MNDSASGDSVDATAPSLSAQDRILVIRGQRVMIDSDLAALYGVPTKRLNEQVRRNSDRFPSDFMFQLTASEKAELVANCDQFGNLRHTKAHPLAFTEFGAIQAANVLASPQAVAMGIHVVRAFVRLRDLASSHADLALRLSDLEHKAELLARSHGTFSESTSQQLKLIFHVLRELTDPAVTEVPRHPIGFVPTVGTPRSPH